MNRRTSSSRKSLTTTTTTTTPTRQQKVNEENFHFYLEKSARPAGDERKNPGTFQSSHWRSLHNGRLLRCCAHGDKSTKHKKNLGFFFFLVRVCSLLFSPCHKSHVTACKERERRGERNIFNSHLLDGRNCVQVCDMRGGRCAGHE